MLDGAFVIVDKNGVRTHISVGGVACLMLGPGKAAIPKIAALVLPPRAFTGFVKLPYLLPGTLPLSALSIGGL